MTESIHSPNFSSPNTHNSEFAKTFPTNEAPFSLWQVIIAILCDQVTQLVLLHVMVCCVPVCSDEWSINMLTSVGCVIITAHHTHPTSYTVCLHSAYHLQFTPILSMSRKYFPRMKSFTNFLQIIIVNRQYPFDV